MKCGFLKLLLCGLGIALFGVPASAQVGWGIVADGRGQFYFCDIERDRVWKLDQQNRLQLLLTQNHCHMLVGGWDGNVYGEDIGAEGRDANGGVSLWRLAADGTQSFVLPPTKNPDVSIGIVRDREGNTYQWHGDVQEKKFSRILKRGPDGRVTLLAGSMWGYADGRGAEARFTSVGGMAAGPDGALYVADERHLRQVTPDGTVTTLERKLFSGMTGGSPNLSGLFNRNLGVTVDEEGNVYVVDLGSRRVIRRTPQGVVSIVAESGGMANALTGNSWGCRPTGITRAGNDLYLMETWPLPRIAADLVGSPRIRRIAPDGRITTVATVASLPVRAVTVLLIAALALGIRLWWKRRSG